MEKFVRTDAEWRAALSPEQYRVTRRKGTEPPFSGEFVHFHGDGVYHCVCCGAALFDSRTKFDSGSGWPSFYDVVTLQAVVVKKEYTLGVARDEITGHEWSWGEHNYVRLGPEHEPVHIVSVRR